MNKRLLMICTFLALGALSAEAFAMTRAVACNGCSDVNMANAATDIATVGTDTIYVFNRTSKAVKKFQVFTHREDAVPFTIVKEASELPVESDVRAAYVKAVDDAVENQGRLLELPEDFPIKSAAGAYRSPNTAMGYVNQYLSGGIGWLDSATLNMNKLVSGLLARLIPVVDINGLVQNTIIVVKYPDESMQTYRIEFVFNVVSSDIEYLATPVPGTGTDQWGDPIPELPSEFAGRTFEDTNGAIGDWVEYARDHQVSIMGVAKPGFRMTCTAKSATYFVCSLHKP